MSENDDFYIFIDDYVNATNFTENYSLQEQESAEEKAWFFVFFAVLVVTVLILNRLLHDLPRINQYISEASLVLLIGILAGFFVSKIFVVHNVSNDMGEDGDYIEVLAEYLLSFSPNIFFMAMLPPIIFNSGYVLHVDMFFRHIKPIVLLACVGTIVSAFVTGLTLSGVVKAGLLDDNFKPSTLELLTFGSLIAATDTVSVLSVLQSKKVDPHLFALVFGESALNDAVALVLFNTFSEFLRSEASFSDDIVLEDFGFLLEFVMGAVASPILGVFLAVLVGLLFNYVDFRQHPMLELPLYALLMYLPFVIAECLHMSGIVTIFFSGIAARRYVVPNVSTHTAENGENIFKVTAYLAEICIFLELGLSVFGLQASSFNFYFIVWAFGAALLGRAVSVYSLTYLYNWSLLERLDEPTNLEKTIDFDPDGLVQSNSMASIAATESNVSIPARRVDKVISIEFSHFLWFSGLRGAVAYACARKFPNLYG